MPITRKHGPGTRCFCEIAWHARDPEHEPRAATTTPTASPPATPAATPIPSPEPATTSASIATPAASPTPTQAHDHANAYSYTTRGSFGARAERHGHEPRPRAPSPTPAASPATSPDREPEPRAPATSPGHEPGHEPGREPEGGAWYSFAAAATRRGQGCRSSCSRWRARNTSHVLGLPAPSSGLRRVIPVGGRDERVEQQRFHRRPVSQGRAAQLRRDHAMSRPAHQAGDCRWHGPGRPSAVWSVPARPAPQYRAQPGQDPSGPSRPGQPRHHRGNRGRHRRPAGATGQPLPPGGSPRGRPVAGQRPGTAGCGRSPPACSPGRSASLIRLIAGPRTLPGSHRARPGPAGSARKRAAPRPGWALSLPAGGGLARAGWSIRSWAASQSRRSWSAGFQDATEARNGTGPPRPGGQAGPAPAGPSASSCPRPAHRAPPAARSAPGPALRQLAALPGQVIRASRPGPLRAEAEATRRRWSPASPASPMRRSEMGPPQSQETGSGYGSFRRRMAASAVPLGAYRDGQLVGHLGHGQAAGLRLGSSRVPVGRPRQPQRGQAKDERGQQCLRQPLSR